MSEETIEIEVEGLPVEVDKKLYEDDPDEVVAEVQRIRSENSLQDTDLDELDFNVNEPNESDDNDDEDELDEEHWDAEDDPAMDGDDPIEEDVDESAPIGDYEGEEDDE